MKAKIRIKAPKNYEISSDKMNMDSTGYANLEESLPFTLKADDFISFAELDLKGSSAKLNCDPSLKFIIHIWAFNTPRVKVDKHA